MIPMITEGLTRAMVAAGIMAAILVGGAGPAPRPGLPPDTVSPNCGLRVVVVPSSVVEKGS